MIVQVFQLCPFRARAGEVVVGLRFTHHDEGLVTTLKLTLAQQRVALVNPDRDIRRAGGWLPHAACWYAELPAWNAVQAALLDYDTALCFETIDCPPDVQQYPVHGTVTR